MKANYKSEAELIRTISSGIRKIYESEDYLNYLKTMSRFHKYSYANSYLIFRQKPDATLVAGYKTWKNQYHRYVKKGEKGIRIYAPVFKKSENSKDPIYYRPVYVFDISQTEGEPLPSFGSQRLTQTVENYHFFLNCLQNISPCPVTFQDLPNDVNGYYNTETNVIVINENMGELQTVKTLIHEIAHALLWNLDKEHSRAEKEVEAESVAFAVCEHFKMDTSLYSFPYIAAWAKDKEKEYLENTIGNIVYASHHIIDSIEKEALSASASSYSDCVMQPLSSIASNTVC